jgi:hypothetical protein
MTKSALDPLEPEHPPERLVDEDVVLTDRRAGSRRSSPVEIDLRSVDAQVQPVTDIVRG